MVGQPNSGKSTLFNTVVGYRSLTGNFPGVTVHYARGKVSIDNVVSQVTDLPGTYSLTASSPAESATRDYLLHEPIDVVINVIDASVLPRSLSLTLQLIELGSPIVVCLNMMDEAHRKGLRINEDQLSEKLGVPVVQTIAVEGFGVSELFDAVIRVSRNNGWRLPSESVSTSKTVGPAASEPRREGPLTSDPQADLGPLTEWACSTLSFHRDTERQISLLADWLEPDLQSGVCLPPRLAAIKLLEGDEFVLSQLQPGVRRRVEAARELLTFNRGQPAEEVIASERHALALHLFEAVTEVGKPLHDIRERVDSFLTHPFWGYVALSSVLLVFFGTVYGLGSLIERPLLDFFSWTVEISRSHLDPAGLGFALTEGLLEGVSGGLGIVLPYLVPFLVVMAILEDVGYLARAAFLADSFMHRIGVHGTAIVPAVLGYGCNVPAVMATRVLTSPRDRFIAAVIASLTPCSARMTVILGLVAFYLGPIWALGIYLLNLMVIALSGKILSLIVPEETPGMILEIPPYRTPKLAIVVRKTWLRMREFIFVAWPLLAAGSLLLSMGNYFHWTQSINNWMTPVTSLLGLPEVVGSTLIFGVVRKELSMLMLFQALGTTTVTTVMSTSQIVVFTLFVTFYIPCVATLAATWREVGWRLCLAVAGYSLVVATLVGFTTRVLMGI